MTKNSGTPARPYTERVLPAITVHVEFQPLREETTARDIAKEMRRLLPQVTQAKSFGHCNVTNHKWGFGDDEYSVRLDEHLCRGLINTEEAGEILGVSVATVRRWVKAGDLGDDWERGAYGIILIPRRAVVRLSAQRTIAAARKTAEATS